MDDQLTPEQQAAMKGIGEINALLNTHILMGAMQGDVYRKARLVGGMQQLLANTNANELEIRLLISLIDKLESLIRGGMEFTQALDWLRNAGWVDRLAHHTNIRMER